MNETTPRLTIAVTDDYEPLRHAFARMLTTLGLEVVIEACNGKDLLAQLDGAAPHLPDLCLLDMNMPVMDGYTTIDHLRVRYPGVRILAMSFAKEPGEIDRILAAGAHGFVLKDVEPEVLVRALTTYPPVRPLKPACRQAGGNCVLCVVCSRML